MILAEALNTGPFPIEAKEAILGLLMPLFTGFAAKSVDPLGLAAEDRFTDKLPIDGESSFRPVDLVRFGDCMD